MFVLLLLAIQTRLFLESRLFVTCRSILAWGKDSEILLDTKLHLIYPKLYHRQGHKDILLSKMYINVTYNMVVKLGQLIYAI